MFGEESMYGVREVKSDTKCRIVLPRFTNAERDEKIVVSKGENEILLYSLEYVDFLVKGLEDKIINEKDKTSKRMLKETLDEYLNSLINITRVDAQKRVCLYNLIEKDTMYKVIGARTYIKVKGL